MSEPSHLETRNALLQQRQDQDEQERAERATRIMNALKALEHEETQWRWQMGALLHAMHTEEFWKMFAESHKEFVEQLGMGIFQERQRRKNYELFIHQLGLPMDDERLLRAIESKLFLATNTKFRAWAMQSIREASERRAEIERKLDEATPEERDALERELRGVTDFIDLAQPPEDGGLGRADLRRHLEEQVGLGERKREDAVVGKLFSDLRAVKRGYFELTEDEWTEVMQELRDDAELGDFLRTFLGHWQRVAREARKPVVAEVELPEGVL